LRLAVIFLLALSLHLLHAQEAQSVKELSFAEKMRPHLMKIIGEEWTFKLIGAGEAPKIPEMQMPPLPIVASDAKSTAVYEKKEDKIKIDPKIEQKFNYAYIKEVFEATRQSKPTDEEMNQFMNVLSQGGTRDGIYRSLVLDATYAGMEEWDKPVKSATADFAVYFYEKYLGKKIQKKSFEGWSVFTLKRLITEKALDIMEAYGDDREKMEKWYAIMSSDLAKKFPTIWSNNLRKNPSAETHKAWASKVPLHHIKSEIIIKIHAAFNSMM